MNVTDWSESWYIMFNNRGNGKVNVNENVRGNVLILNEMLISSLLGCSVC